MLIMPMWISNSAALPFMSLLTEQRRFARPRLALFSAVLRRLWLNLCLILTGGSGRECHAFVGR